MVAPGRAHVGQSRARRGVASGGSSRLALVGGRRVGRNAVDLRHSLMRAYSIKAFIY
jgi:hypothetical protein